MKFSKLSTVVSSFLFCQSVLFPYRTFGHGDHEEKEDPFCWTKEMSEYADIQIEIAGPGIIQNYVQVSGKIITHPDHLAYVISKANGAVKEIRKNIGDSVEKGEVLALIESKEVAEAKAEYLSAIKQLFVQKKLFETEETLRKVSAAQDYLKAKLAYEEAAIHYDSSIQNLYTLGFSKEEISHIDREDPSERRFFAIKAPLKGKVTQRNLTLGDSVDPSTKAFTIANFDKVWIEINVAQNDVQFLKDELPVEISGIDGKQTRVKICQFNPMISEETRMATAIAVMDNASEKWTPGEFVSAHIQTSLIDVPLVVSREAIQNMKGEYYVFVEEEESIYPQVVKLGKMDDKNVEIISGLNSGDNYVTTNAFCLKAEHEKGEAEHD